MRPRTTLLLPIVALLWATAVMVGAVAGAPQALAASSEVKLEIAEHCYFADWPCWNVKGNNPEDIREIQPFAIAQGGTISFEDNEARYPTDVLWKGTAPSCTAGVPEAPPTKTNWSGTCTFARAGEYEFESQDLFIGDGFNYTQYKVIVETLGAPVVSTGMASAVDETEGTLQAAVDPEGKGTEYFFEWGKSSGSYEHTTAAVTLAFQDTSSHDVSEPLAGLTPATTYHYRVVAKNSAGTTDGEDRTLTTASPPGPPNAITGQASVLGETAARLTGTVDPDGRVTSYLFQWGTSESYGHSTSELPAGSDHSSHAETAALSELTAGTVYHFRIVAKTQTETVMGADETFTTASPPPPKAPSPISSPIGGNPIATAATTPPAPSQDATAGSQGALATTHGTEKEAKPPTRAQRLARALKRCEKQPKKKRAQCKAKARKLYAPKHKAHKS